MFVEDTNNMFTISHMKETNDSKLRAVLDDKGISPAEFGRLMGGLKSQTVNNWLNRGVPHSKAVKVASVLDVELSLISQNDFPKEELIEEQELPKTVDEYIARYGEKWKELDVEELTKLMGKLAEHMQSTLNKAK